jgi:hypothetical protein
VTQNDQPPEQSAIEYQLRLEGQGEERKLISEPLKPAGMAGTPPAQEQTPATTIVLGSKGELKRIEGLEAIVQEMASQAESQVLNSVREWAQDARLSLSSVKPERTEKEKDYYKITFRATASGTMQQVTRFLYSVQTGSVPARITDVSITSRKEGTDDLTLTLGIATIHPVPESEKPRQPGAPPAPAGATASAAWSHAREVTP